jgi:prepilin-type N-terminal cleavage/methylation domain-containing protein
MRRGFTVIEVVIVVALFSVISITLMELLTAENRTTAALMDDLTVNNEARSILQHVSRDIRSATEVVLEQNQINPPENEIGLDESRGKLLLRYASPVVEPGTADLWRFQVEYKLVGKNQPPPATVPQAKAKSYTFLGQSGTKWVFPLLREVSVFQQGTPRVKETKLIGWVRELDFYQRQPPRQQQQGMQVQTVSLPTVYLKLVMSAFKPGPAGAAGLVEAYREEFRTGVTVRSIVPSITGRL